MLPQSAMPHEYQCPEDPKQPLCLSPQWDIHCSVGELKEPFVSFSAPAVYTLESYDSS